MHRRFLFSLLGFLLVPLLCVDVRADAVATTPFTLLWIEHGGNFESLGNERIIVRFNRTLVYERGRAVEKKDPKYGKVLVGACDRFTTNLSEAELAALNSIVAKEGVTSLEASYRAPDVHDGTQAGLLLRLPQRTISATFDNKFPPAYTALLTHLRTAVLARVTRDVKPGRCDPGSWIFIRAAEVER